MTGGDSLRQYAMLLEIRSRSAGRNAAISRWLFLLTTASFFALGMLGRLPGASAYVGAFFVVAFGAGYLTAWSRHDTARALVELIDALRREFA